MDLIVKESGSALWNGREMRCAVGRGGLVTAEAKREGDGKTPLGRWPMREVFYRPDRLLPPVTVLPVREMKAEDAWCDVSHDPMYNRRVDMPYATLDERLWREDPLYDVVVILGYNDDPIVPGAGSAIFLHIARPDYSPSSGCVTLAQDDLLTVLREADRDSAVRVLR